MKLNHINLGVTDVEATVQLFEQHFGLKRAEGFPQNKHMGFTFDDNGSLVSVFRATDVTYPKIFHVGFLQDSREAVLTLHRQLQEAGFGPQEPREEHGRFVFYFVSPGGFLIEVSSVL